MDENNTITLKRKLYNLLENIYKLLISLKDLLMKILVVILILFLLILSISALSTISVRQSTLANTEKDLINLQERISTNLLLKIETTDQRISIDNKDTLSTTNLENIRKEYLKIQERINSIKNDINQGEYVGGFDSFEDFTKGASSNVLLGILLITCGMLGALVTTLRNDEKGILKSISLGGAIGFISLLAIKGGSTMFLISNGNSDIPINVYSIAFFGIVAGMFSEKVHIALSQVTEKILNDNKENNIKS